MAYEPLGGKIPGDGVLTSPSCNIILQTSEWKKKEKKKLWNDIKTEESKEIEEDNIKNWISSSMRNDGNLNWAKESCLVKSAAKEIAQKVQESTLFASYLGLYYLTFLLKS